MISQINKNGVLYYLNNNHGDVIGLSDAAGNIVDSYKYDAFGNTISSIEKIANRFRYAGEQYDQVTNQYYLRSRFYNPVIGRFTQEDTYRGDGLNLYEYVHNNPVKYIDPSGNACESKEDIYKNNEILALPAPEERLMLPEGVSEADKLKLSSWKYAPDEELYLKYKDVFDNPKYYNQKTGEINWPGQHRDKNIDGFLNGEFNEVTLKLGEKIDRYGSDYGSFASPEGISYGQRALAPGTNLKPYSVFEVIKPMKVKTGETAPWFNETGGGIQYVLPDIIDELLDAGVIRRVK